MEPFDVTLIGTLREHGIFTHITTDHPHYFEIGGENYCQMFHTWNFERGQEGDVLGLESEKEAIFPSRIMERSIVRIS